MKIAENLFNYFKNTGTLIKYQPNDIIYMQEDSSNNLYLILKGRVRVYLISKDGQEITLDIIDKGRIFGESSFLLNTSRPVCVSAIDEVKLISCNLENLYPAILESNRVTVTKILNDFYQKGWIDLAYRKIIIVDHDELSNYLDK